MLKKTKILLLAATLLISSVGATGFAFADSNCSACGMPCPWCA